MTPTARERLMRRARRSLGAGRLDDALKTWRALLLAEPESLPGHIGLGTVLRRMGRIAESEAVLRTGLERHPQAASLMAALAETLAAWEATDEAVAMAENAVRLAPTRPEVLLVLARLRLARGEDARGRSALEAALEADSRHVPAMIALGRRLRHEGNPDRALLLLDRALQRAPKDPEAAVQRALALLAAGRLAEGFRAYEGRWQASELRALGGLEALDPGCLPWDGTPLGGRCLLIRHEQGLSECLQFCRLIAGIDGGRTVFEVPPELVPLIRASRVADAVVPRGQAADAPAPEADCWAPLMSLPDLLSVDQASIPADIPYLRADPSLLAPWRNRLGGGVKIGIAWRGGDPIFEGRRRAVPLAAFAPLASLPGVRLISLQKGEGRQEIDAVPFGVEDPSAEMDEGEGAFLDTAAVMDALALIVTADTAIAHLAGALGRPVWCVMPEGGDWRFGWEPRESPWYPSMTCFRRGGRGGWDALFADLALRIEAMREGRDPDVPVSPGPAPQYAAPPTVLPAASPTAAPSPALAAAAGESSVPKPAPASESDAPGAPRPADLAPRPADLAPAAPTSPPEAAEEKPPDPMPNRRLEGSEEPDDGTPAPPSPDGSLIV